MAAPIHNDHRVAAARPARMIPVSVRAGHIEGEVIMKIRSALPYNLPPRLLKRPEAAAYVGVSVGKFDELVRDGRMPGPKLIDRRRAWDVRALDCAIDQLPDDATDATDDSWSDVLNAEA